MNSIKLWKIIECIEEHFPISTQENWDNSGLQVGDLDCDITGIILSLDLCDEVLDEAIRTKSNLIITHHPLIFHPIKSVTQSTGKGRTIIRAIKNGINIYSSHTPADKGQGGLNDWISEKISLVNPCPLSDDGIGLVGALKKPMKAPDFSNLLKYTFSLPHLEATFSYSDEIRIVAFCSGSGMSLVENAIEKGADTFLTGDISWGGYSEWKNEINLCNITHYHSEKQFAEIVYCIIKKNFPKFALQCHNVSLTDLW